MNKRTRVRPRDHAPASLMARNLDEVAGRLRLVEWLRAFAMGTTVGVAAQLSLAMTGVPRRAATLLAMSTAASCIVLWMLSRRAQWTGASAARAIERATPDSHNIIVTAEELLRYPDRARSGVRARVFVKAHEVLRGLDRRGVVSLRRQTALAAGAVALATLVAVGAPERAATSIRRAAARAAAGGPIGNQALTIVATITPPPYTEEPPRTVENPDRIEALEGSQLRMVLRGPDAWRARFGADPVAVTRLPTSEAALDLTLAKSGYLAIERADAESQESRRLVPIAVIPDRAPTIRIDAPAKDLLLPDATSTIPVAASATDDFGLQSLDLRYTKVSGSGEQFEFREGSIPLAIDRSSSRSWTARSQLALSSLALAPGDSLIYRVVGRDRRPGDAGLASSDTFFIEVAGPGQLALEGFELPPDRERYALSQQMIVLKLERLRVRERSLDRQALEAEVASLAAEQRAVRANFIFLTGGTVEDEEEEAAHSHEIQEGRLEDSARREIVNAIQYMSRAEQGLANVSVMAALPPAKAAVAALQKAFGRNRYFLRTLPVRSRVDPSRRLSGELSSASDWRRELFPSRSDDPVAAARRLLGRLLELAPDIRAGSIPPAALTALAEESIAIDPAAKEWQAISRELLALRDDRSNDLGSRSVQLNRAVTAIVELTRGQALTVAPADEAQRALRSAWQEGQVRK